MGELEGDMRTPLEVGRPGDKGVAGRMAERVKGLTQSWLDSFTTL